MWKLWSFSGRCSTFSFRAIFEREEEVLVTGLISGTFVPLFWSSFVYCGWCYLAHLPPHSLLPRVRWDTGLARVLNVTCSVLLNDKKWEIAFSCRQDLGRHSTCQHCFSSFFLERLIFSMRFDSSAQEWVWKYERVVCNGVSILICAFLPPSLFS